MNNTRRSGIRLAALGLLCLTFGATPTRSHAQTQTQMDRDAQADFRRTDAALAVVYRHVAQSLPAETARRLAAAEKAWRVFRDADARFSAGAKAEGGSMYPMAYDDARTALTRQRIARLRKIALPKLQSFRSLSPTDAPKR